MANPSANWIDDTKVFAWMEGILIDPINESMDAAISNLSGHLKTPATIMATILIIFYGFKFIYGRVDIVGFITIICRIAVVTLLVTNAANFNFYVKDVFFDHLPNGISNAISSENKVEASAFDQIIIDTNIKVTELMEAADWYDIGVQLVCILIAILIGLLCTVGFLIQSFAKLGLAIVISLGPVFICLYMWDSTKRFTEAWIGQAANFIILQLLVVSFLSILVELIKKLLTNGWMNAFAILIPVLAVALVSKVILISLPFIASALAGGGAALTGMDSAGRSLAEGASTTGRASMATARAAIRGIKKLFGLK